MIEGSHDARLIETLTPRQFDVLELLARGLTNREIGSVLGITALTARTHITAILRTLDVTNRVEAAVAFERASASMKRLRWLSSHPGLCVVPFETPPGVVDPVTNVVAFGLLEDLVDQFSRFSWFPVIRGPQGEAAHRDVGRVFMIRGGVRREGDTLRITVSVSHPDTGASLWADRYDVDRSEVFRAQDTIATQVVSSSYPALMKASARLASSPRVALVPAVWELTHDAISLAHRATRTDNEGASALFRRAADLDGGDLCAQYGLGLVAYYAVLNQWRPRSEALPELEAQAALCIERHPDRTEGYYLSARALMVCGEFSSAVGPLERAVSLNPSHATSHAVLAQVMLIKGHTKEGSERMAFARRLGPGGYVSGQALAHFCRQEYREALLAADQVLLRQPRYVFAHMLATASAWWADDAAGASLRYRHLMTCHPGFSIERFYDHFSTEAAETVQLITEAVRSAARK